MTLEALWEWEPGLKYGLSRHKGLHPGGTQLKLWLNDKGIGGIKHEVLE